MELSKLKLNDEQTINFKDETARHEIQNLKNKNHIKMIMLGDSFGVLNSDNDITKFYWEYVREGLGLTQDVNFFSLFQNGAGFGNNNFITNLQTIGNNVAKEEITDILVSGGWNDKDTTITNEVFDSAIETFNNYVKTNFPNARVTIAHISWGNPIMKNDYEVFQELPVTQARYKKACNKYGWRYLTGVENILHNYDSSYWQTDGTHPNQKGQERLGTNLVAPFLTGSCDIYESETGKFPSPAGISTQIKNTITYNYLKNDITQVLVESTEQNVGVEIVCDGTTINCSGNHVYKIGKLNSPYLSGFSCTNEINRQCLLYGKVNGQDKSYLTNASFFVDKGDLWIRPFVVEDMGYVTQFQVLTIIINGLKFTNPTIIS